MATTLQQQKALDTRHVSVALSAGAGCGKTFVLTERFLSHLEPPRDDSASSQATAKASTTELSQLVAITFTERAAREMRERIRHKTLERLVAANESDAAHWLKLLRELDSARISTFHSFCATLLRNHAVEAQIDPRFQVLEASQSEVIRSNLAEDLLRELLTAQESDTIELAKKYGLDGLRSQMLELHAQIRSESVEHWLKLLPEELVTHWTNTFAKEFLPQKIALLHTEPLLLQLKKHLQSALELEPDVSNHLHEILGALQNLLQAKSIKGIEAASADLESVARVQGKVKPKDFQDAEFYEQHKKILTAAREFAKELASSLTLSADLLPTAETALQLLRLAHQLHTRFQQEKASRAVLDFDDLQHLTRALLQRDDAAEWRARLARDYHLLLVDECQDTDQTQVDILSLLCGEKRHAGKLFIVGDFKQSIYRFRGADPQVFVDLRADTPPAGRLPLSQNFRSQPGILHFVNALFADALQASGEPYEALTPHREALHKQPCVEFLWANAPATPHGPPPKLKAAEERHIEARWIAKRIQQMLCDKKLLVQDKITPAESRPVELGDIAILLRVVSDLRIYEQAFQEAGLPYYVVGGKAFYTQQEIYDVLNLLRALQNPNDEIALAGALRSPLFGLQDETLFWLTRQFHSLSRALQSNTSSKSHGDDNRAVKLQNQAQLAAVEHARSVLNQLRSVKDRLSIADLLNKVLELTQYDAALTAEFLGERKLANVRKLIDQARSFDQSGLLSLSDFLVQLSESESDDPKEPLAATHPENTNVIKIMTIHKSKGLEFPVVFVPNVDRAMRANSDTVAYSRTWGPLCKTDNDDKMATPLDCYKEVFKREAQAEALRLFYVATTRAADHLVLCSCLDPTDEKLPGPWLPLLAERFDLQSGDLKVELPDDFSMPRVQVIQEEPAPLGKAEPLAKITSITEAVIHATDAVPDLSETELQTTARSIAPCDYDQATQRRFSVSRLSGQLAALGMNWLELAGNSEAAASLIANSLNQLSDESSQLPSGFSDTWWNDTTNDDEAYSDQARRQGVLVHDVLSRWNPKKLSSITDDDIKRSIVGSAEAHELDATEAVAKIFPWLSQFAQSPRANEITQAKQWHSEVEFLLPWSAESCAIDELPTQFKFDAATKDKIKNIPPAAYLQGFLDLLYQDQEGRYWILDYKTNRVTEATLPATIEHYLPQIHLYALAVENALGISPAGMILHFLRTGREATFAWNDDARQKGLHWLAQSMALACPVTTSS